MKVSSDAVLLGAWANLTDSTRRIADIGTGSGIIALMMAQRAPQAAVEALEIDAAAAAEAAANVADSPWPERVNVRCGDFADWIPAEPPDMIVSNPPYFTESLKAPDGRRALARHAGLLSPVTLIERAPALLGAGGTLAMITPANDEDSIQFAAAAARLSVERLTRVVTVEGKSPSRLLWQLRFGDAPTTLTTLTLRDAAGSYTTDYTNLVKDFYLWLH